MSVAIRQQPATATADNWFDALTKLIPGEVIAAFTAALLLGGVESNRTAQLVILIVLAPFAALLPLLSVHRSRERVHPLQYVVRVAAFVMYGLANSPELMSWLGENDLRWIPGFGALVVPLLAALVIVPPRGKPSRGPA